MIRFALIGAGLSGRRRLLNIPPGQLVGVHDLNRAQAEELVKAAGSGRVFDTVLDAVHNPKVDAVIVSTVTASLAEVGLEAIEAGKHVLLEAPGATSPAEIQRLTDAAAKRRVCVRVGFNLRFRPAVERALALVEANEIGPVLVVRGRYGQSGYGSYAREWKANPKLSGGGLLLDEGAALIDLARVFLGEIAETRGSLATLHWDVPVEDQAFLELRASSGRVAWLHASATEWRPIFSFEIIGRRGKIEVEGLGGIFGRERLHLCRASDRGAEGERITHEFPEDDGSWRREIEAFAANITREGRTLPRLEDASAVLRVVQTLYRESGRDDEPAPPSRLAEVRGRGWPPRERN